MGLDSVEILVKVENTFGIQISNADAERLITVGDYHYTVWKYIGGRKSLKCPSQQMFYKLRKSFAGTLNFPAGDLRLDISPENVFPKISRRQSYLQFASVNGLQLPELVLRPVWNKFLTAFGFATIFGGLLLSVIWVNFFDSPSWLLISPLAGIGVTWLVSDLLDAKRTIIPCSTIRSFTQEVLARNYATVSNETGPGRKEMETIINHIIANMTGLELSEILPEKSLTDDLGID